MSRYHAGHMAIANKGYFEQKKRSAEWNEVGNTFSHQPLRARNAPTDT